MKKSTLKLVLLLIFIASNVSINAQDYQVEFAILNEGFKPETILVENLDQGTNLTLNGGDILNLTGIPQLDNQSTEFRLYPNPTADQMMVEFLHQDAGHITVQVIDLLGKVILEKTEYQTEGLLSYEIKNLSSGSYLININSANSDQKSRTAICISQRNNNNQASLDFHSHQMINKSMDTDFSSFFKDAKEEVTMQYNEGETLKFTAFLAGENAIEEFIVEDNTIIPFFFENLVFDIKDNIYHTKIYGDQRWMTDNLATELYRDSTEIPYIITDYDWATAEGPAFNWWNHDEENAKVNNFGGLYNWFAVETDNICPLGWHVPSQDEWHEFIFYIAANGYNYDGSIYEGTNIEAAGSKIGKALAEKSNWLETTYGEEWAIGKDMQLNNATGFNGIGADGRYMGTGVFLDAYFICNWWSSDLEDDGWAWTYFMFTEKAFLFETAYFVEGGYSVRCIQND